MDIIENDKSTWVTNLIRWVAWMITSAGVIFDGIIAYEAWNRLLTVWQTHATEALLAAHNPTSDLTFPGKVTYIGQLSGMFVTGCAVVAFAVINEVYLRRGEVKGLLYKRIGIIVAVELAIALVAFLIQQFVH